LGSRRAFGKKNRKIAGRKGALNGSEQEGDTGRNDADSKRSADKRFDR